MQNFITGYHDKNGMELRLGDRIKVPDNPDISPYDIGYITYQLSGVPFAPLNEMQIQFTFFGQLSIIPLSWLVKHYQNKIEKL